MRQNSVVEYLPHSQALSTRKRKIAFLYCKQRKAGQGTRLIEYDYSQLANVFLVESLLGSIWQMCSQVESCWTSSGKCVLRLRVCWTSSDKCVFSWEFAGQHLANVFLGWEFAGQHPANVFSGWEFAGQHPANVFLVESLLGIIWQMFS